MTAETVATAVRKVAAGDMLQHFFASVGKPPDRVTSPEVVAWGYGVGLANE